MAMCDKRNQLITQAVLDKLGSGTGIYTSDDILIAANISDENLRDLLGKLQSNVKEVAEKGENKIWRFGVMGVTKILR